MKNASKMLLICAKNEATSREKKATHAAMDPAESPAQMSFWNDSLRAIPDAFARCPIFGIIPESIRTEDRIWYKRELLPSPDGFEMRYTGFQMGQLEGDIFMQIVNDVSGSTINAATKIHIDRAKLLRTANRTTGGSNYAWLDEVITRLNQAHFDLDMKDASYSGNLILEVFKIKDELYITLSPTLAHLFHKSQRTLIDWQKRMQISKQKNLAKWLQAWIGTNMHGVQRYTVKNLSLWSGYKSPERKFRDALYAAASELERVGVISDIEPYENGKMIKWVRL